jgi:hypothetical protein
MHPNIFEFVTVYGADFDTFLDKYRTRRYGCDLQYIIKLYLDNKWIPTKKQFRKITKYIPEVIPIILKYNYYMDQQEIYSLLFDLNMINQTVVSSVIIHAIDQDLKLPSHIHRYISLHNLTDLQDKLSIYLEKN